MIENRDIIAFGLQPWDLDIAFTLKYTAIEMSVKNRVLFVNPPLQRSSQLKDRNKPEVQKRIDIINGKEEDLVQVGENMWVFTPRTVIESINWINSPAIFDFFNKRNDKRFAKEIKRALDKLDFKDYIFFNDNSMIIGYYLKELLNPSFSIYLLRDAVTLVSYHAKHGKRLEPKLISKMDLMVANSDFFADFGRQFNPHSYMIGQGCDLSRYSDEDGQLEIPDDLKAIEKKPIIGYVGFLTTIRLDIDVLVHIAKSRPEYSLVLVGPEDEDFRNSELHQIPNVTFLGRKAPEELPAYIKGFDVALNPQIVNQITDINYPLKIDEYLAMGKATVATKTTFMAYFKDYVHLPTTKEEYIVAIDKALKENNPKEVQRRIEFAGTHTWENFVKKIYKYMIDVIEDRK
jgi:glycosyltransferase involved in cell wall biosynthesis